VFKRAIKFGRSEEEGDLVRGRFRRIRAVHTLRSMLSARSARIVPLAAFFGRSHP